MELTKLQQQEREANAFAIALLMPEKHVRRELSKLDIHEDIELDFESDKRIKKLADKFEVSEQLMLIRLSQLGFFKK